MCQTNLHEFHLSPLTTSLGCCHLLQAGGVLSYSAAAPSLQSTCGPIVAHATAADVLQIVDTSAASKFTATLALRCTIDLLAVGASHVALCGGGQVRHHWMIKHYQSTGKGSCQSAT